MTSRLKRQTHHFVHSRYHIGGLRVGALDDLPDFACSGDRTLALQPIAVG